MVLQLGNGCMIDGLPEAAACIGNNIEIKTCNTDSTQITFEEKEASIGPDWTDVTGENNGVVEVKAEVKLTTNALQTQLLVLVESEEDGIYAAGSVTVNGVETALQTIRSEQGFAASSVPAEEHWVFLTVPLNQGENDIKVNVQANNSPIFR